MTCQVANTLKSQGVKKGDVVAIYMPVSLEAAAVMLACTRIGAVHRYRQNLIKIMFLFSLFSQLHYSVVFAGFSPTALKNRILDGKSLSILFLFLVPLPFSSLSFLE